MPDDRLARARRSLPAGYQFGDARKPGIAIRFVRDWDITPSSFPWRPLHENEAVQLVRRAHAWNVIEGEEHGVDEAHDGAERTVSTPARGLDD